MGNKSLGEYNKYIIQMYRALNRQYNKENAIDVVSNLILRNFNFKSMYFDIVEDDATIIIKNLLFENQKDAKGQNKSLSGVFHLKQPIGEYKKTIYLEDEASIRRIFPCLKEAINPKVILSVPVFSQKKLIGVFIVYDKKTREIDSKLKKLVQLAAQEFTAVFSRIDRHNLELEKMLGLTALENILLSDIEEDETSINNHLRKIVSALPKSTGMKYCALALIDKDGDFLRPYCSMSVQEESFTENGKYYLDRSKNKDHTAIIAMETKKPVIIYDALTDSRCDNVFSREAGVYSFITLPILDIKGNFLGALWFHNGQYETFPRRQIRFLKIISRHIGLIISNMDYIGDLKTWSKYDGLTGLLNRRTFENIYDELYSVYRFSQKNFSVLMVDIDDFKSTNDIYGHQVGDKVLKRVAKSIKDNVRERDIVARYGGEEIIIILKDIGKEEAKTIANRIRSSVERLSVNGVKVTVSIGISTFGIDSYNKNNLIYIADQCLYEAKSIGKNQVVSK